MPTDWISFELQRRVDQPFNDVQRAVTSPAVLGTGMTIPLAGLGLLVLQAPFRPASLPYEPALHAPAMLTSSRGRRVALVRLEITAWSHDTTAISLRPLSSRPDRWGARRVEQYFGLAHECADVISDAIAEETRARSEPDTRTESTFSGTDRLPEPGSVTR
ncbi:MAG: hypothetical protein ACLPVY_25735 [Acidimicrobiia bacterium]